MIRPEISRTWRGYFLLPSAGARLGRFVMSTRRVARPEPGSDASATGLAQRRAELPPQHKYAKPGRDHGAPHGPGCPTYSSSAEGTGEIGGRPKRRRTQAPPRGPQSVQPCAGAAEKPRPATASMVGSNSG